MLYFGCWGTPGHYLHDERMVHVYHEEDNLPVSWQNKIDGGFAPRLGEGRHAAEAPQGEAAIEFCEGWTLISFWDRTGDSRPGSSSTFIAHEILSFEQMIVVAKKTYPKLWERFNFEVKLR